MTITNCRVLKEAVADWLDREDLASRIPDFIHFAEARIHHGSGQGGMAMESIRIPAMVKEHRMTGGDSSFQPLVPNDFLEAREVLFDGNKLDLLAAELFWRMHKGLSSGTPKRATIEAGGVVLSPDADKPGQITLSYFGRFPPLVEDTDTNWLLKNCPEVYLFATLTEAAIYNRNRQAADDYLIRYAGAALALTRQGS